jgi:hypothetical protein
MWEQVMESTVPPSRTHRLRIDLADLADAFDEASAEVWAFLNLDTGEVIRTTWDIRQELEAIAAELPDAPAETATYRAAFAAALERWAAPAWMRELLWEADAVEAGLGTRFLRLPDADAHAGYTDMETFIETVASARLRERLAAAIRGRGAFRRFKDVLAGHPEERERWFAFKDGRVRERVRDWLASEGIAPIPEGE